MRGLLVFAAVFAFLSWSTLSYVGTPGASQPDWPLAWVLIFCLSALAGIAARKRQRKPQ